MLYSVINLLCITIEIERDFLIVLARLIRSRKVREKKVFCHSGQGKSGNVREFKKKKILK